MLAPSTADVDAKFGTERRQTAFQRPNDAGGDTRGVPIHAHDGSKRLEPERVGEAPEKLVPAIVMDNPLAHHRPEPSHSVGEPFGHMATVQGQVGASRSSSHAASPSSALRATLSTMTRAISSAREVSSPAMPSMADIRVTTVAAILSSTVSSAKA